MKKLLAVVVIVVGTVGIAACSPTAQNETVEAGQAIAADANATMNEAISDVDAATDKALGAAQARIDNASDAISNATDKARDHVGNTLESAGAAIKQ